MHLSGPVAKHTFKSTNGADGGEQNAYVIGELPAAISVRESKSGYTRISQESLDDVANVGYGVPLPITASKGGIGNDGGANDERRFGQFSLAINF